VDVEKDESTTLTADSRRAAFYGLTRADLPVATTALFGTACVFGGASPGLLAARVLENHARIMLIVERDDVNTQGNPAAGVSQDRQAHVPPPVGLAQIERWLPGTTCGAQPVGTYLVGADR
jgi:hypothetical protein